MKKLVSLALLLTLFCTLPLRTFATEKLIYFGDTNYTIDQNKVILDDNDTGGDVTLQFGKTLNEKLFWDDTNTRFVFTDDVRIEGNAAVVGEAYIAGDHDASDSDGVLNLGRNSSSFENIKWNDTNDRFEISDDIYTSGSGSFGGNLSTDGNTTIGSSSADTISINAKLNSNFDFNKNEADQFVIDKGTSFPSTPVDGQMFYRSDEDNFYIYDGSTWDQMNTESSINVTQASQTTQTTTTSTSYTLMNGMSITPTAGDYMITFSGSGRGSTAGQDMNFALFRNGVIVNHSERNMDFYSGSHSDGLYYPMHTQAYLSGLSGSEAIEVRYKTNTGTYYIQERSLIIMQL